VEAKTVNRLSLAAMCGFALVALATLVVALGAAAMTGEPVKREPDEGTGAHIFQLSIAALAPATLIFIATADWRRPAFVLRALALPGAAVLLAFGLLYYFEHIAIG